MFLHTKVGMLLLAAAAVFVLAAGRAGAVELVIGEETVAPGIVFIFEGAVKDDITPASRHLPMDKTHVHLEARVNWAEQSIPRGTPAGGFVPYLTITAQVTNRKTGAVLMTDLLPHINLIDNFHYARNIALPGAIDDRYEVVFHAAPAVGELSYHLDWREQHGGDLFGEASFRYPDVDFEAIAKATRN